jgi:hypothetical protein
MILDKESELLGPRVVGNDERRKRVLGVRGGWVFIRTEGSHSCFGKEQEAPPWREVSRVCDKLTPPHSSSRYNSLAPTYALRLCNEYI